MRFWFISPRRTFSLSNSRFLSKKKKNQTLVVETDRLQSSDLYSQNGLFCSPLLNFSGFTLLLNHAAAAQTTNISLGCPLLHQRSLLYGRTFAFGFRRIGDQDLLLLAIWYDKIPEKTNWICKWRESNDTKRIRSCALKDCDFKLTGRPSKRSGVAYAAMHA